MSECDDGCCYREALEAMRDLVLIKGPESRLLWANAAFRNYYGMTEDELRDLVDGPQSDPDDTLQYVRDDRTVFELADHLDVPSELVTDQDGAVASFHTIKSPIFQHGEVARSVGVSRRVDDADIASRTVTHHEAKAMVKPLRLLTSAFPLAIALVDVRGRVVSTSRRWRRTFGAGVQAPESYLLASYPELANLAGQLKASLGLGRSDLTRIRLARPEGDLVLDVRTGPWHYDDGSIGGALILALDVTAEAEYQAELARSNTELASSNRRYDLVVDGASVGIWDWPDVTEDEEYWSDRFYQLLGYEPGEIPASLGAFRDMLHPDDHERTFALLDDHMENGATFDLEYRLRGKSGAYRWYQGSGKAATDEAGKATRMVGSIQDIDGRVQAEHAVRRVNEDLEHFVHVAAHDLREPTRRQIMLVDLILAQHGETVDPSLRRQLEQVQEQGRKMLAMITGFRNLTGIAGPTLELETFDLEALTTDLIAAIDPSDDVRFEVSLPNKVEGYPTLIEILLENLIRNALVHGSRPLTVNIREVEDPDGEGRGQRVFAVDSSYVDQEVELREVDVFKPFVRSDRETDGSGLGLSICRRVVDRHRGRIWLRPSDDQFSVRFTLGDQA